MFPKPETLYRLYRSYVKRRQYFPDILIKLYTYQVCVSSSLCFVSYCSHPSKLLSTAPPWLGLLARSRDLPP